MIHDPQHAATRFEHSRASAADFIEPRHVLHAEDGRCGIEDTQIADHRGVPDHVVDRRTAFVFLRTLDEGQGDVHAGDIGLLRGEGS